MQEKKDNQGLFFSLTPYCLANLGFKTVVISFSVSTLTQPFQSILNRIQIDPRIGLNGALFRSMYRGFIPYAIAGQKRGAVSVTAKQTNQELIDEKATSTRNRPWIGTFLFAQTELLIHNALSGKSKLENAGVITKTNFNWSFTNYWKLTSVNWGSRSFTSFANFAALGFVGDYISSLYKFDHVLYNKLAGGSTAGVATTMITTLFSSYADRKVLASTIENGHLLTTTSFTMFSQMKSHLKTAGTKEALIHFIKFNYLKEVAVRSPMSALTFGIIFGLDDLMGNNPLKKIWPKVKKIDSKKSEEYPSNKI